MQAALVVLLGVQRRGRRGVSLSCSLILGSHSPIVLRFSIDINSYLTG